MFPASTKGGGYVIAFPDVAKTPVVGSATPIAYPNIGTTTTKTATKTTTKPAYNTFTKPVFARPSVNEAGILRSQMGALHQKLTTMPGGDTTKWHEVVDDYVATTAKLFKLLSSR